MKLRLYSCHEKNVAAVLASLGMTDFHVPEFGSAVVVELLQQRSQYFVRVKYNVLIFNFNIKKFKL